MVASTAPATMIKKRRFHLRFSDSKPKPETRNLNPETNFLSPVILNALNFLNDVNVWSVFYFMAAILRPTRGRVAPRR